MRCGKKLNKTTTDIKKTRSCVVRLEKLSHESFSPNTSPTNTSRRSLNSLTKQQSRNNKRDSQTTETPGMGATPKQLTAGAAAAQSREGKTIKGGPIKKRITSNILQTTPQQKQSANMSTIRSSQKIKSVPKAVNRSNTRVATPASKAATPARDETPTPTIAAGRSRRAIKPNPKYASEDMVTPKMVRNVGVTHASSAKSQATADSKRRKNSTSSDDFYNRNSEDEYEEDGAHNLHDDVKGDKAYKVDEKEESLESDISELEEEVSKRSAKTRGRPRRSDIQTGPQQSNATNKSSNQQQTPGGNIRRLIQTPGSTVRTAPTQLQQLRRSLQSANAQRNQNLLAGSGSGAQKRKLAAVTDPNDSDSDDGGTYTVARKQMLVTTSSGLKLRMPVKENSSASNTQAASKPRIVTGQKIVGNSESRLSLNGGNRSLHTQLIDRKRIIESNKISNDAGNSRTNMKIVTNKQNQQTASGVGNKPRSVTNAQTVSVHQKNILGSGVTNITRVPRTSSPKPFSRKEAAANSSTTKNNNSATHGSSSSSGPGSSQSQQRKLAGGPGTKPIDKLKSALASSVTTASPASLSHTKASQSNKTTTSPIAQAQSSGNAAATSASVSTPTDEDNNEMAANDDSPNSTMDDFETMPTFTIVNVNDIINKKGDVLITKANKNSASKPAVLELTESISLVDDEDDVGDGDGDDEDEDNDAVNKSIRGNNNRRQTSLKVPGKLKKPSPAQNNKASGEQRKRLPLARSTGNDDDTPLTVNKQIRTVAKPSPPAPRTHTNAKPQILNHRLGMRNNARVTAKMSSTTTSSNPDKPAPRILNSVVAKKTQPVKPMITNLDDSAEESFPLSLDEEETEDEAESQQNAPDNDSANYPLMDIDDNEDTESQNSDREEEPVTTTKALTPRDQQLNAASRNTTTKKSPSPAQRKKRLPQNTQTSPVAVTSNKKRILTPIAAKENSLAATNQQVGDTKAPSSLVTPQTRKQPPEKVVISKQGDKIIKKITCFETWYVINMPIEPKRPTLIKNQLDMPLINLANNAKSIQLPNDLWNCKVTLYELSATTLAKGTFVTYMGDLEEYNIGEEDRGKYQPSCVMFRRAIENRQLSRMPYDRAVIFKNKTFSTNIEGKNIRLVGAPSIINSERDIEILLEIVDTLTLQSDFVEYATILQ
ncbi:putative uncharacterized protein DDB_G0291812 [Musca domestica]|uniref:Uncharacterized protein n=1 Tax=Musca domestica TaxID=7370 RepID=A0A9J7I1C5_MUSDO|nr:putative uncharacterized protein DDB_G0291812 [Musca domestica]XP_058983365.1 putative uncharacterized protein DDB_G0291812 [Musca domestica]XP_058983366.1 putative uncharacterized protein DDB_G0291812 [Musca domestica]